MGKIARIYNDGKLAIKGELIEKEKEEPLLYFNGVSQAVTIANTNNRLQPNSQFTWEMWFKLDGYTQYNTLMGFSGNNMDFARMDSTTNFRFHYWAEDGSQQFLRPSGFPPVDDGEWHHIVTVWDGINGFGFCLLDGIEVEYITMPQNTQIRNTSNLPNFTIGGSTPTGRLINGWIKEVRMWQMARTQEEILSTMDIKLTGNEEGLKMYLPLNEGKGRTVIDKASGYVADLGGTIWQGGNKNITLTNSGDMEVYGEYIEGSKNSIQDGRLELIDIIEGGV